MEMKRFIVTLCIFFAGFCLFDSILGPSRLGLASDILGFAGGIVAFFVLTWLSGDWTTANSREIFEKGFLYEKVQKEVEKAIATNKNVVNIVVSKVYHPKSGVYYNVHAEGN
jgi:hypothetical protein